MASGLRRAPPATETPPEAVGVAMELDYFALALVLLQAILLYRIGRRADSLRGPRLLAAARAAQARSAGHELVQRGERRVHLDEIPPPRRAMLQRARSAYLQAGGELDELWEPFVLRFLVAADWDEAEARAKLLASARWRREHGVNAIRKLYASSSSGRKLGQHPCFGRQLSCLGLALAQ